MELDRIKTYLTSEDSQERLKAITALKQYEADVAVPLLQSRLDDPEFIVRSFVAMGLGRKQSDAAFDSLLKMLHSDRDYNVRAEAASSLALYGEMAIVHLVQAFRQNGHWLIRRSILASMQDMPVSPALYEVCEMALADEDLTVRDAAIDGLGLLARSAQKEMALAQLLRLVTATWWHTRYRLALAFKHFDDPHAQEALRYLSQDEDHRVVGATLERLL
jgi:HEAT repeat protein